VVGVVAAAAAGAILGDNVGYGLGRLIWAPAAGTVRGLGRLTPERLVLLHRFFEQRGPLAVFAARFIAVLRTFGPFMAGAAEMRYRTFLLFNALGGAAWATVMAFWASS